MPEKLAPRTMLPYGQQHRQRSLSLKADPTRLKESYGPDNAGAQLKT